MNLYALHPVFAAIVALLALAQTATFRVKANLVLTPVHVSDSNGNTILDLKPGDFDIEENGIRIEAARLGAPGEAPLELAMLFDMSGSVYTRFEIERQAAARFLNRIFRPQDSVFIISVANQPLVLQERTSSLAAALQTISRLVPTTQATAFYSSIAKALSMLQEVERPEARRVMVVLSDGEDNRSIEINQEEILKELQLANCLFFSINPNGGSYERSILSRRAQKNMESMAQHTGGASFVANTVEDLTMFYNRIADELQGQYLLGYYSPANTGPGIYRRIMIKVRGMPNLQVKARTGYYPK